MSREALRTFRLDRVSSLEVCSEIFNRPTDFNPQAYLRERMPLVQSEYQIDVWIEMPIAEAESNFAPWRIATEVDGAGTRLRCWRDQLERLAAMLLSMGRRIVVFEPKELRETFKELSRRAIEAAQEPEIATAGPAMSGPIA